MIKIGEYLIQCNTIKWEPDSQHRHDIFHFLVPYWVAEQKRKLLDGKKIKNSI